MKMKNVFAGIIAAFSVFLLGMTASANVVNGAENIVNGAVEGAENIVNGTVNGAENIVNGLTGETDENDLTDTETEAERQRLAAEERRVPNPTTGVELPIVELAAVGATMLSAVVLTKKRG